MLLIYYNKDFGRFKMAIKLNKDTMLLDKVIARNSQMVWLEQDILVPTKPLHLILCVSPHLTPHSMSFNCCVVGKIIYIYIYLKDADLPDSLDCFKIRVNHGPFLLNFDVSTTVLELRYENKWGCV